MIPGRCSNLSGRRTERLCQGGGFGQREIQLLHEPVSPQVILDDWS